MTHTRSTNCLSIIAASIIVALPISASAGIVGEQALKGAVAGAAIAGVTGGDAAQGAAVGAAIGAIDGTIKKDDFEDRHDGHKSYSKDKNEDHHGKKH
ncbi:glycine zipper domain-containing protein [Sulfitobacter sp. SK012]|uniref:glycine zipper domain-containing protein n=1 Tax=Sulfitobacter sp. SK012 TaxID=1389005 RepID=UPI000E09EB2F|nr:glycine zipper domain-containing protein [Sulfitobacter sp. SK012]